MMLMMFLLKSGHTLDTDRYRQVLIGIGWCKIMLNHTISFKRKGMKRPFTWKYWLHLPSKNPLRLHISQLFMMSNPESGRKMSLARFWRSLSRWVCSCSKNASRCIPQQRKKKVTCRNFIKCYDAAIAIIRYHSPSSVYNLHWRQALETPLRSSVPPGVPFQYLQQEIHIHLCTPNHINSQNAGSVQTSYFQWPVTVEHELYYHCSCGQWSSWWRSTLPRAKSWILMLQETWLLLAQAYLLTIFFHLATNASHGHLNQNIKPYSKNNCHIVISQQKNTSIHSTPKQLLKVLCHQPNFAEGSWPAQMVGSLGDPFFNACWNLGCL